MFRSAAVAAALTSLIVFAAMAGCTPRRSGPTAAVSPSPPAPVVSPSPTKPFGFEATVQGLDLMLTDPQGRPMARLRAKAGTVAPEKSRGDAKPAAGDAIGILRDGTATLYQGAKPVATLSAETITADRGKRTVTGRGNVVVRSLTQKEATSIRADTMVWEHDTDRITGQGNVLLTRSPDARLPGERFEADTEMRRFTLFGNGEPATGTF